MSVTEGAYSKPLPSPTPDSEPFWEGCRRGELLLQRCGRCGRFRFYPRLLCPACGSDQSAWQRASGRGVVHAITVVHRGPSRAWAPDCPYVVALVELDEGVRMMTNLVDCPPEAAVIGLPVEVVFDSVTPEVTLPKFRPTATQRDAGFEHLSS